MLDIGLELRITLEDDRTLAFELNSSVPGLGYYRTRVGSVRLAAVPRQQVDVLFEELSQLARQGAARYTPLEQADISARLAGIGQRLYRDLFPEELKRAYRRIRLHQVAQPLTLLITSDEPWIPWELVKPFERIVETGEVIDDPFFCERFYLTRWLAGVPLHDRLEVAAVALVVPASDLHYAQRESDYLNALAQRAPQTQVLPPLGAAAAVRASLREGAAQLWHMACHGNFSGDTPDRSAVRLEGGELRSEDLVGPIEVGVGQSRPLVMLNACHTGRQGFALTGLGGWAQQFLRAGASAFVGAQWEAHDALAAEFAVTLYEHLWSGMALGQAAHAARQQLKTLDATNPTWLTYAVYGDPNLRIWLKGQAGPEPAIDVPVAVRPLPPVPSQPVPAPATTTTRSEPPSAESARPTTPLPDGFVYDAFVSYRHADPDMSWVRNVLVPRLDAAGLRICLDARDFAPGAPVLNEMMSAVEQSRRTIAVLSNSYLQGPFAEVENLMAQTLGVEEGQYRLLPVRFQAECRIPLRIRMLLYVDLADPAHEAEAMQKLIAAIRALPTRRG